MQHLPDSVGPHIWKEWDALIFADFADFRSLSVESKEHCASDERNMNYSETLIRSACLGRIQGSREQRGFDIHTKWDRTGVQTPYSLQLRN